MKACLKSFDGGQYIPLCQTCAYGDVQPSGDFFTWKLLKKD